MHHRGWPALKYEVLNQTVRLELDRKRNSLRQKGGREWKLAAIGHMFNNWQSSFIC